jgi:peptide/nickel transport system permease protein
MRQSAELTNAADAAPNQRRRWLLRARRSRPAILGACGFALIVLASLLGPLLVPYGPIDIAPVDSLQPPNRNHFFGTDTLGRDIFSRVLSGGRISLRLGLFAVAVASTIGITIGLIAGYYGNVVDSILMRIVDALLAFPSILLSLAIVAVLGSSLDNVMIAVGIASVPSYARLVRGGTLSLKESAFVDAARVSGSNNLLILVRHILPNLIAPVIVLATLGLAGAIFAASSLSYLGVGAQPPTPEWGSMVSTGRSELGTAWWMSTFPGLAIVLSVLSINMLGDGIRDVIDPRLSER